MMSLFLLLLFASCSDHSAVSSIRIVIPAPPTTNATLLADENNFDTIRVWLSQNGKLINIGGDTVYLEQIPPTNVKFEMIEINNLKTGINYQIDISIGYIAEEDFETTWFGTSTLFIIEQNKVTNVDIELNLAPTIKLLAGTNDKAFTTATGTVNDTNIAKMIFVAATQPEEGATAELYISSILDPMTIEPIFGGFPANLDSVESVYKNITNIFVSFRSREVIALATDDGSLLMEFYDSPQTYMANAPSAGTITTESLLITSVSNDALISVTESKIIIGLDSSLEILPPEGEIIQRLWLNRQDLLIKTDKNCYIHKAALTDPNKWIEDFGPETLTTLFQVKDSAGTAVSTIINDMDQCVKDLVDLDITDPHSNIALFATDNGIFYTSFNPNTTEKWVQLDDFIDIPIESVTLTPFTSIQGSLDVTTSSYAKALVKTKEGNYYMLTLTSPGDDGFKTVESTVVKSIYLGFDLSIPGKINSIKGFGLLETTSTYPTPAFIFATDMGVYIMQH